MLQNKSSPDLVKKELGEGRRREGKEGGKGGRNKEGRGAGEEGRRRGRRNKEKGE